MAMSGVGPKDRISATVLICNVFQVAARLTCVGFMRSDGSRQCAAVIAQRFVRSDALHLLIVVGGAQLPVAHTDSGPYCSCMSGETSCPATIACLLWPTCSCWPSACAVIMQKAATRVTTTESLFRMAVQKHRRARLSLEPLREQVGELSATASHEALAQGLGHGFRLRVHLELRVNVPQMKGNGVYRDAEGFGGRLVVVALHE